MTVRVKHATLTASTVATVTLTGQFRSIEVLNRDGAEEIYFTVDGTAPTVAGDECYVLPKAVGSVVVVPTEDEKTAGTP